MRLKNNIKFSGILFCLLLSACAPTLELYAPPQLNEPQATLLFESRSSAALSILRFFENGSDCTEQRRFPDQYNPFLVNHLPLPIPADKEIAIGWYTANLEWPKVTNCDSVISFTPKSGEKYRSEFLRTPEGCIGRMMRLDNSSGEWVEESTSTEKKAIQPFYDSDPWCTNPAI